MTQHEEQPRPSNLSDLFWAFSWLSLQGFGGVLAVVHRELVEKRKWLTPQAFLEDWAVAQVMPGPNVCNLALMFGDRNFGLRGAFTALAGLLLFPLLLDQPAVTGALRGMGAVAAGLIAGSALKLLWGLQKHPLGFPLVLVLSATAFVGVVWLHLALHLMVLGLGGVACCLTWYRIHQRP